MWEEVSPEDILTPQEVFAIMQKEGLRVDYERLPGTFSTLNLPFDSVSDGCVIAVTDEQAPIPGIFSRIEQRVSTALTGRDKENVGCAWNCQMGKSPSLAQSRHLS